MISRRTIAHLQHERMVASPDSPSHFALVESEWTSTSNREALGAAAEIAMGLWSLGVRRGEAVAVMSESSPEWALCDAGALDIGAVVVSVYPTSTAETARYIIEHSGAKVAILENPGHLRLLGRLLGELSDLEHVVVIHPDEPAGDGWISLTDLRALGAELAELDPTLLAQARDAVQPSDLASLMYTSGTTGNPKGVPLTHEMLFSVVETLRELVRLETGDTGVVYLPMSHILQRVNNYLGRFVGLVAYFAPSVNDLVPTCHAAGPRAVSGVPRVFEKVHAAVMAGVEQAPPVKQRIFNGALAAGHRRVRRMAAGESVPLGLRIQHALFERLVYAKLRTGIFGPNIEFLSSGGAPINPELVEFFFAIGLPLYEGYGLTETSSPITYNHPGKWRIGTVGAALPGSEVKIADDGEVLLRGPSVFREYFRDPAATEEAFTDDGWFMSGDIGELDDDGFLRITDRKKSLIITAAGKNVAPAPIEQRLIQHPLVGQVVIHGDRRKHLAALVALDPEGAAGWAASRGKQADVAVLASDPDLGAELDAFIESVNRTLARYETVKQYRIVPEEFSVDNGLLTPSLKVKRRLVEETFAALLDEMYAES